MANQDADGMRPGGNRWYAFTGVEQADIESSQIMEHQSSKVTW